MTMLTHQDIYQAYTAVSQSGLEVNLYGLIDHAGMPGLGKYLTRTKIEWLSLLAHTGQDNTLKVAPLLFRIKTDNINRQDRDFLDRIAQYGTYASCLMFMASPLSIAELAQRLSIRLDAVLPDDMEIFLRFYDPRIFEQLVQVLLPEQKQAFLSVAPCWWFVDRRGALQTVKADFLENDLFASPLQLNAKQESALIDASEPDQIAQFLKNNRLELYKNVPLAERYDFILRHSAAAKKFKITATHELAHYCILALSCGEKFAQRTDWQAALQKIAAGEITLQQAAESIPLLSEQEQFMAQLGL